MSTKLNKYSSKLTEDVSQPSSRVMLHGAGLAEADFPKAQTGIVSSSYEGNPCNIHLNKLTALVKQGTKEAGMIGLIFNTIGVGDAHTMGTTGMRYSLPSRILLRIP